MTKSKNVITDLLYGIKTHYFVMYIFAYTIQPIKFLCLKKGNIRPIHNYH